MSARTKALVWAMCGLGCACHVGLCANYSFGTRPSLVDTISLNPSGTSEGTGCDLFGATTSFGFDLALGFALRVANSYKVSAVEFLVSQRTPGQTAQVLVYKGAGITGGSDMYYWTPSWNARPVATFSLVTPLPKLGDTNFHAFRFEPDSEFYLEANTPYVMVFDPVPTANGDGDYVLANVSKESGFISKVASPQSDVFMPSYLVKRQTDVKKKYLYNSWTFTRQDRRYLVAILVPEPAESAGLVGLALLLGGILSRRFKSASWQRS